MMKLSSTVSAEYKNSSNIRVINSINNQRQMVAPGGSSCTLGCSCSCSCGAVSKKQ